MNDSGNETKPLDLTGVYEGQEFHVNFPRIDTATVADLAREVHQHTGLQPLRQRIEYRGIVFDPPDTDKWAPLLDDLTFRSGDRFDVSRSARPVSEVEAMLTIKEADVTLQTLTFELEALAEKRDRVHQGFAETGNQLTALAEIRQSADLVKDKLMVLIKDLNALHLDHRNYEGQARRRETVDSAQRQIDKCVDVSANIFHKLAQSQQLAHAGALYSCDPLLASAKQRRNPKRSS
ncbi:BAG family molecular chaperone regulator 1 [Elysia marginata]|uniref:BAG family molecular chaperone regulator 1 n=1 Tax=Elysia marginata TaxID=1093978 RepID=A0AAV4I610_9GAST|nr:BAG family molecular chaperone regulator 1 [Elysia marginata]